MDKWTHPLEPPIIKWLHTAVTLAIILWVLQLEHVRLMQSGALLHLYVNVSSKLNLLAYLLNYLYSCTVNPLSLTAQTVYDFNNSVVSISLIGEGDSALTCHTELITCCREQDNPSGGALGEWIGPDSNQIPESSSTSRFYVTRQQSSISLNHGGNSIVRGQYCCVIPRTGGETTFCVQVQMDGKLMIHRST